MTDALSIMDVKAERHDKLDQFYSSEHVQKSLATIARAIDADADALQMQFEDTYPRVRHEASRLAGSANLNRIAWKNIMTKLRASRAVESLHPTDVVRDAVELHMLFGPSSSGVEQGFSLATWAFGSQRQSAHADTEEMVVRLVHDLKNHDQAKIIKNAQRVWVALYGSSRRFKTNRITKGMPRSDQRAMLDESHGSGTVALNETEFIKSRRSAIAAESSTKTFMNLDADALMAIADNASREEGWSESMMKELAWQKKKLQVRKTQAAFEGVLEADESLQFLVKTAKRNRLNDHMARERKRARIGSQLQSKTVSELLDAVRGKKVYVDAGVSKNLGLLNAAFIRFSMTRTHEMHNADVFVVHTPGKVGERAALVSGLRGAFQITPQVLSMTQSISNRGVAAKLRPVASIQRTVYVSEACYTRHRNTFKLIQETLDAMPSSKTVLVTKGWDALAELQKKFTRTPGKLIVIARENEKNEHPVYK